MKLSGAVIKEVIIDDDFVLDQVEQNYSPTEVFVNHIAELHEWARENGYVKKDRSEYEIHGQG